MFAAEYSRCSWHCIATPRAWAVALRDPALVCGASVSDSRAVVLIPAVRDNRGEFSPVVLALLAVDQRGPRMRLGSSGSLRGSAKVGTRWGRPVARAIGLPVAIASMIAGRVLVASGIDLGLGRSVLPVRGHIESMFNPQLIRFEIRVAEQIAMSHVRKDAPTLKVDVAPRLPEFRMHVQREATVEHSGIGRSTPKRGPGVLRKRPTVAAAITSACRRMSPTCPMLRASGRAPRDGLTSRSSLAVLTQRKGWIGSPALRVRVP